jgi:hypothetical protein
MPSKVDISNRALQKLGAKYITSMTDGTKNARSCNLAYEPCKLALLRDHTWNRSIKRAQLAASATEPDFGPANIFPLPADFVRLLPLDPGSNLNSLDWQIESDGIHTDDEAPLQIRYVGDMTDPNQMDALMCEALSTLMAFEMCEEVTQSNTKQVALSEDLKDILARAKRTNAIENVSQESPEDTWITVRN